MGVSGVEVDVTYVDGGVELHIGNQRIHGEPDHYELVKLSREDFKTMATINYDDCHEKTVIINLGRYGAALAFPYTMNYESTNNFDYWSKGPFLIWDTDIIFGAVRSETKLALTNLLNYIADHVHSPNDEAGRIGHNQPPPPDPLIVELHGDVAEAIPVIDEPVPSKILLRAIKDKLIHYSDVFSDKLVTTLADSVAKALGVTILLLISQAMGLLDKLIALLHH